MAMAMRMPALSPSGFSNHSNVAAAPATGMASSPLVVCMANQSGSGGTTSSSRQVKVLRIGDKSAILRPKSRSYGKPVKLLSRIEQLKLLTKAENAGLLSTAEKFGLSLSKIESLGLLSKAEEWGLLSAATDLSTPARLLNVALLLLVAGPLFVYFVPDDSAWQVASQVLVALLTVVAGPAAFAASNLVSALQKSN